MPGPDVLLSSLFRFCETAFGDCCNARSVGLDSCADTAVHRTAVQIELLTSFLKQHSLGFYGFNATFNPTDSRTSLRWLDFTLALWLKSGADRFDDGKLSHGLVMATDAALPSDCHGLATSQRYRRMAVVTLFKLGIKVASAIGT